MSSDQCNPVSCGQNLSFVCDILHRRSSRPGIDRLLEVACVLKLDRDWLTQGIGDIEGTPLFIENPDEAFVSIAHARPPPSMGGGAVVLEQDNPADRAYHFRRSWIPHSLKACPSQLRIMHVEGDSMAPTLLDGETVQVDMALRAPNPPGICVLDDGMGLVAKRLEHFPNSNPPAVRVVADKGFYTPYERTADEIHIVGGSVGSRGRSETLLGSSNHVSERSGRGAILV